MKFGAFLVWAALASPAQVDEPQIDVSKLPPAADGHIDFTRDIHPLFAKACFSCHGPDKQRGGLRLDDRASAMQGSNSGPVIKPGKALESRLLHVVGGLDPELVMPPKEKTPLTKVEIAKLRAWIDQGASWPQETAKTTQTKAKHRAFQPLTRPRVPMATWNPIDAFVLARLQKEKLAPSPEADRVTLIRRLHLDLLGLPPSPKEVDEFLNDIRPDAYERLVERVLSSPHYGERWGRHWLDLARYADSDGYEADRPRPFAWRYRNWVIDAFNRDMPFDQFTVEQLAGDLLPNASLAQKTATGFHRNTLTNKEGGTDKEQFRVEACVDRVNTTFKAFFGLTMGCAQCHDHKYDPFSQREYYQLFALFNSDEEVDLPASYPGDGYAQQKAAHDKKRAALQAKADDYKKTGLPLNVRAWEEKLTADEKTKLPANISAILAVDADKRNMKQQTALLNYYGKLDSKLAELTKAVAALDRTAPKEPVVPALALGKGRKTHVMIRGDFLRPGVEVNAATPGALHSQQAHGQRPVGPENLTRLDLAKWITQPENPLTPRVIVNWVWHRFFGRGIVATLEDFGTQGEKPSHPELLDFLASYFIGEAKWSFKELHKLIVTSATYKQSSAVRPELLTRDPANILLARQSRLRLEGEIIRDNALAASGLLHRAIGGPSVKPPQPPGISELTYANSAKWVESKGPDRYRRGMYTWFQRTSPYPMLMTFDSPDGVLCCVRREKSNTPLQALTLLNDAVFVECAQALAKRVLTEAGSADRIDYAFRICAARSPTDKERASLSKLLQDLTNLARSNPTAVAPLTGAALPAGVDAAEAAAWVAMARTLLNLDEFVTRE